MDDSLIVGSVNIRHCANDQGENCVGDIAQCIADLPWQLLALQEVDRGVKRSGRHDQLELICEASGAQSFFAEAFRLGGGSYGVGLLWRGVACLPLPSLRLEAPGQPEPRVACLASLGGRATVAATHLDYLPDLASLNLLGLINCSSPPSLILGDFNLQPGQLDLPEGWAVAGEGHLTFPADNPQAWIDHVLYRRERWVCQGSWTERLPATDHLGFFAELSSLEKQDIMFGPG